MAVANAATISWSSGVASTSGSFGQFLDTGLFTTTGTLILAENTGGGALSFDGINFAAGTIGMGGGSASVFHENTPTSNTLLARTGSFGTNGVASNVNLTGLTSGHTYRIQALVYDGRGDPGIPGRTVEFDGINQGQYANGIFSVDWGDGLLVTGTFVADATTQDFTIETFNSGSASTGGQLNAITLYQTAIPEPSTALLGGLGLLALLRRRRA
jgi:hypothetical protein